MKRKSRNRKVLSFLFLSLIYFVARTQENHYWTNQFGPTSTFLSGAVTGGVRDNSLIFYNPGAAAFTSEFNLSLQSDALFNQNIYVRNGAGTGINVQHNRFESTPQLFAITYGNKKRPNWRTSFGWLTTTYSNIRLRARNEVETDIYSAIPGEEIYIGSWNYRNRVREDWYGFALTRKLGEKIGLGISTFLTMRSYEYIESQDQNILSQNSGPTSQYESIRYIVISDNLDGAAAGLLWKIGLAYEIKDYKFGLTVTTPRAQVGFLASMTLNSSIYSNFTLADSGFSSPNYSVLFDRAQSVYKSPWIIDFGVMKNFFNTDVYLRIGYFGKVPSYELVIPTEPSEISKNLNRISEGAGIPYLAQKEVWNIAIGWNRMFTEKFGMMAGFRTDFNYIDVDALNKVKGFTPELSYWNLYHLSGGTNVKILKHNITMGLTYTFGQTRNKEQFVNLNVPDVENREIFSRTENNANAYIDDVFLTLGYIYNFK